jgi:hypothetical protein
MTWSLTPDTGADYRALIANLSMGETVCIALEQVSCKHLCT